MSPDNKRPLADLLILGDGIHSLEMAEIVDRVNALRPTWRFVGFISLDPKRCGEQRVVGASDALERYPDALLVPDNEWPRSQLPNRRFASLIDPSVFISKTASVGRGCVVYPHCFVGANARIGDFVFCLSGSIINHDGVIEDRVIIASGVTLAGNVYVESDCYLGQSCSVRQHGRIGRGSVIGMGAVVVKNVPSESTIVGNPGRDLVRPESTSIENTQ